MKSKNYYRAAAVSAVLTIGLFSLQYYFLRRLVAAGYYNAEAEPVLGAMRQYIAHNVFGQNCQVNLNYFQNPYSLTVNDTNQTFIQNTPIGFFNSTSNITSCTFQPLWIPSQSTNIIALPESHLDQLYYFTPLYTVGFLFAQCLLPLSIKYMRVQEDAYIRIKTAIIALYALGFHTMLVAFESWPGFGSSNSILSLIARTPTANAFTTLLSSVCQDLSARNFTDFDCQSYNANNITFQLQPQPSEAGFPYLEISNVILLPLMQYAFSTFILLLAAGKISKSSEPQTKAKSPTEVNEDSETPLIDSVRTSPSYGSITDMD